MATIKVILAEDHTIVRKGLRSLLDAEPDIVVVDEAADGREAIGKVERLRPDVVLMDITMPRLNGLEATRQLRKLCPEVKVVILTVHTTEEYVVQVLRAGARGYLIKQAAVEELILAIRAVCRGEQYISPSVSGKARSTDGGKMESADGDNFDKLSDRECEVLQLVAEGRSNREMALLLHVSVKTIEAHRSRLTEKLDIHTTAELTLYALRKGLISAE